MVLKLCSRCKKRVAVIYMQRIDNGNTVNEGLCLKCAREMGLKPVDDILERMGITPEEFDAMSDEISGLVPTEGMDNGENEGRAPSLNLGPLFPAQEGLNLPDEVRKDKQNAKGNKNDNKKAKPRKFLEQYCIDLTGRAKEGKLDKVIGRSSELERVMQILCRRQKNNPCLIGEPGVGKTAVAEALAARIVAGTVPYKLKDKEVMLVDMTAMVAGTQFRGQFESRMKGLIEEVKQNGNIILVIDEVHSIVGAGDAEGGMNAANILKPALSRGEIQLIGATTLTEYRKYIEKDAALERRFQPVMINEPSIEDSIKILEGIKENYEKFHGIRIPDGMCRRMVVLSERYITDRYLPDKAIDLMDEACANLSMNSDVVNKINSLADEIKALNEQQAALEAKTEKTDEDFASIASVKTELIQKNSLFDQLSAERDTLTVTEQDLAKVIEIWTGIPASSISENEFEKIQNLVPAIKDRIVGQDEAVEKVAKAVRRSRAGISYKKKPVSFIFAGPTGIGKTELVKVLASYLFDSPESLIRLDMSEYMEKYSVSRIIGSPPGYVGYDEAGQLSEKIRRKPYSVVLFDEIEKAHPDVLNILLQILDDGRITDSHGKTVNFENAVIVMTTNAGSTDISSAAGFTTTAKSSDEARVRKALEQFLRPEFINRVDDIVVFNRLDKAHFASICRIMLGDLEKVLNEKDITLSYDEKAVDMLVEKGYSDKYGARNLRRLIQTEVEDALATALIENTANTIKAVSLSADENGMVITTI